MIYVVYNAEYSRARNNRSTRDKALRLAKKIEANDIQCQVEPFNMRMAPYLDNLDIEYWSKYADEAVELFVFDSEKRGKYLTNEDEDYSVDDVARTFLPQKKRQALVEIYLQRANQFS